MVDFAGVRPSLKSSLAAAGRLYAFRRFRGGGWVHASATALLAALSLGIWAALDRQAAGAGAEFSPAGLAGVAWYMLAGIAIAWFMARQCTPALSMALLLWTLAAIAPLVVTGQWLSVNRLSSPGSWAALAATGLLAAVYAARTLEAAAGRRQTRAIVLGFALAIAWDAASEAFAIDASLWQPSTAEDAEADAAPSEQLLFAQPDRIDAAVARVAAPPGAGAAAFMVGFAGVGEQRVFAEEVGLAARVIGSRYGTQSRTVLLVNDQRDLNSLPLATVSGLRRTLRLIAARMHRDRDVLFLVLSSHGSDEPAIAVSNAGLPLDQLDGEELAAALADSGIRWKVIVISACYSGGFIPALADPGTIILTAAAADRTSFGCSSDRDLTYFGEAFFRDALPKAATLKDAYAAAAAALAARERAEGFKPSRPQAYFGAAMVRKLSALERERAPAVRGGTLALRIAPGR